MLVLCTISIVSEMQTNIAQQQDRIREQEDKIEQLSHEMMKVDSKLWCKNTLHFKIPQYFAMELHIITNLSRLIKNKV